MRITKDEIKKLKPCTDAYKWYLENEAANEDLPSLLLKTNTKNPSWSRWLFTRLMNVKQRGMLAVFAAEQALPIFEKKYPEDNRPRKAIEAAKAVIENDTVGTRAAADAAAYAAAYAAADAAADAAAAAYAAADAAAASAAAAYAADAAAYAAAADAADARTKMQITIITEAVRILEAGT